MVGGAAMSFEDRDRIWRELLEARHDEDFCALMEARRLRIRKLFADRILQQMRSTAGALSATTPTRRSWL